MDSDEEEGLRAFTLSVGSYAAYPEHPQWINRDGVQCDVVAIESEWREEERIGFRLRLADGASLVLYYVPELDLWSGVWPDRGTDGIVRRRHERGRE